MKTPETLYTANINKTGSGLYYLTMCNARQGNKVIWETSKYRRKSTVFKKIFELPVLRERVSIIDNTNEETTSTDLCGHEVLRNA